MKINHIILQLIILVTSTLTLTAISCNGSNNQPVTNAQPGSDTIPVSSNNSTGVLNSFYTQSGILLDSVYLPKFFNKYPLLKPHQKEVTALYNRHQYNYIWFDK